MRSPICVCVFSQGCWRGQAEAGVVGRGQSQANGQREPDSSPGARTHEGEALKWVPRAQHPCSSHKPVASEALVGRRREVMFRDFKWQRLIFIYVFNRLLNSPSLPPKRKYISFGYQLLFKMTSQRALIIHLLTGNSRHTLRSALNLHVREKDASPGVTVHRFRKMPEASPHTDRSRQHSLSVAFCQFA